MGRGLEYVNFCTKNPNLNFFLLGGAGDLKYFFFFFLGGGG